MLHKILKVSLWLFLGAVLTVGISQVIEGGWENLHHRVIIAFIAAVV
jgi:hypothetical protein